MGKASSQWDFGELFSEEEFKKTYSVSELTGSIRKTLESQFGRVRVTGEVSNFRLQASGHCYFGLKDSGAQLNCVLFRGERVSHRSDLENGVKVVLEGDLTVYEARGQYQLIVRSVELQGIGALQQAYERLKKKLEEEGLFAPERKRPIPEYCFRVGLVTSSSAAALRDVLQVAGRRHSSLVFMLRSSRVQGQGAADEIAAAIADLNRYSESLPKDQRLQCILVTRGGGSLEDLWAFNEEVVARAVAASELPVLSAVGHEVDFTICDFVSDMRAPTPSAAAELITEGVFSTREMLENLGSQLKASVVRSLGHSTAMLEQIGKRLLMRHPRRSLDLLRQRIDDLEAAAKREVNQTLEREGDAVQQLSRNLAAYQPGKVLLRERDTIKRLAQSLELHPRAMLDQKHRDIEQLGKILRLLSPLNVLERGYSITRLRSSGDVVRSVSKLEPGTQLTTLVQDGEIESEVTSRPEDAPSA